MKSPSRALAAGLALGLTLAPTAGCRVPAPKPPQPFQVRPSTPRPDRTAPRWFSAAGSQKTTAPGQVQDAIPFRPRRNENSPLGANLPPLDGRGPAVFTNRFLQSTPWASVDWKGRPNQKPLDFGPQGWIRTLAPDQVAETKVRLSVGARYVVSYAGDGRLAFDGVENVERVGPRKVRLVAARPEVVIRLERTSPAAPLEDISVLPESWASAAEVPKFDPAFLDLVDRFSVLRFCGWSRVGQGVPGRWASRAKAAHARQTTPAGVAYEHMFDLARQIEADLWLCLPFSADEAYARGLAELIARELSPTTKVYVELGDEAWQPDDGRPGHRYFQQLADAQRLDPDPLIGRLFYQAKQSKLVFQPFYRELGSERLVRVVSAPLGAPNIARLLLRYEDMGDIVDAVAVAPRLELRARSTASQLEQSILPKSLTQLRAMAKVVDAAGVDLLAYAGGLSGAVGASRVAHAPTAGVVTSALIDGWKDAGGRLFVSQPLFGALSPVRLGDRGPETDSAQYEALLRVSANGRWWKETRPDPPPLPSVAAAVSPPAQASVVAEQTPAPSEPLYTAPWAKWVSLGLGVALGGLAAERFVAAEDAARVRDEGLAQLSNVSEADRFDQLQLDIRGAESDRELAQGLGFAAVGVSSVLIAWAFAQWLEEPPKTSPEVPVWAEGGDKEASR